MKNQHDKGVIQHWLRLYNWVTGSSFRVADWPDKDSSKKNIDAICKDERGRTLAIEHTLIEPFDGEKADAVRFSKTLATLEHHPDLLLGGYHLTVSQPVGSNAIGTNWAAFPREILRQLPAILPGLPEGASTVALSGEGWTLNLLIDKQWFGKDEPGRFFTGRVHPGDPGSELVHRALEKKAEKLATSTGDFKILLLEKDSPPGTIERQFEQLPDKPETRALLSGIDQIWSVNTVALDTEKVIFANQVMPPVHENRNCCSLNIQTGKFWRVDR